MDKWRSIGPGSGVSRFDAIPKRDRELLLQIQDPAQDDRYMLPLDRLPGTQRGHGAIGGLVAQKDASLL